MRVAWNKGKKGVQIGPNKGRVFDVAWRRNLSRAHKGQTAWNKGVPMSATAKARLSKAKTGRRHTLATRKKMSKTRLKVGTWNRGVGLGWPEQKRLRNSLKYKLWREAVFKRDDWTCQARGCGKRGVELHADHVKPFATHPRLRFKVSNGRTLCVPCHRLTPTYGIKALTA